MSNTYCKSAALALCLGLLLTACDKAQEVASSATSAVSSSSSNASFKPVIPKTPPGPVTSVPEEFLGEWYSPEDCEVCDSKDCKTVIMPNLIKFDSGTEEVNERNPWTLSDKGLLVQKENDYKNALQMQLLGAQLQVILLRESKHSWDKMLQREQPQCDQELTRKVKLEEECKDRFNCGSFKSPCMIINEGDLRDACMADCAKSKIACLSQIKSGNAEVQGAGGP